MSRAVKRRPQTKRFDRAPQVGIQRSTFDLSYPYKTTFNSGFLIPLPPQEVLPGDSFRLRMYALARLATPLHPTMDNLRLSSFFFFVPNRLVWDNWQKFMGEQNNPGDSTDFTVPTKSTATSWAEGTLMDYMGLPIGVPASANSLPMRASNLCWNEWFRDENLQNAVAVPKGDGPDDAVNFGVYRRGKRKDYLSSSLPWPQKGPGVDLPLGTTAPIFTTVTNAGDKITIGAADWQTAGNVRDQYSNATTRILQIEGTAASGTPTLLADLTQASAATINELRQAFQIQKLLERDARGGTRYTEILKSHFQVVSPDSRLQRPEYLGGGVTPVSMRSVPQQSSTDQTSPQGNLAAYAESHTAGHGFSKSFVEHGYIIGFIQVSADLNYEQRIDRMWSRSTKYDYYWPALQALGEQAVLNKEIFADGTADDNNVWGYQERWAEYRTNLGVITGRFRSKAAQTLNPWHYALDFKTTRPLLNATFIEDNPPVQRTIAVQDQPEFLFDAWFDIRAARPMPVYSVPGYTDHF